MHTEFLAGETLYGLAKRHDVCCNLIRIWVAKYEAADLLQQYEAKIAALERLVGKRSAWLPLRSAKLRLLTDTLSSFPTGHTLQTGHSAQ